MLPFPPACEVIHCHQIDGGVTASVRELYPPVCHLLGSCSILGVSQLSQTLPAVAVTGTQRLWWPPSHSLAVPPVAVDVPRGQTGTPCSAGCGCPLPGAACADRFTSASLPSWAAEGTGPGDGGGGMENRTNVVQMLCIIILLSTAPTLLLPTAFGSGHPMETGLCSRLLHLSGIWPEAWVPARARQGGGSPESGDR